MSFAPSIFLAGPDPTGRITVSYFSNSLLYISLFGFNKFSIEEIIRPSKYFPISNFFTYSYTDIGAFDRAYIIYFLSFYLLIKSQICWFIGICSCHVSYISSTFVSNSFGTFFLNIALASL